MTKKYYLLALFLIVSSSIVHAKGCDLPARASAISVSNYLVTTYSKGFVSLIFPALSDGDFKKLNNKKFSYEK